MLLLPSRRFTSCCTHRSRRGLTAVALLIGLVSAGSAQAAPINLSSWTAEGNGNWVVAGDNNSVTQTLNNNPTVFFGPGNAQGNQLSGTIRVNSSGDDDFIGFVLGYGAGDLTAGSTDFLLIDWKQNSQSAFGCIGQEGLAVSRVTTGLANDRGAWCKDAAFGVEELARGTTLGNTGWVDLTQYAFDLIFTPTNVQVFVNNVKEIDIAGNFANGGFGFYNYSQANVTYGAIEQVEVPPDPTPVPEPATMSLLGVGLAAAWWRRRRAAARA